MKIRTKLSIRRHTPVIMEKKKVAIIGVTGSVGQEFVLSLDNHPAGG